MNKQQAAFNAQGEWWYSQSWVYAQILKSDYDKITICIRPHDKFFITPPLLNTIYLPFIYKEYYIKILNV